MKTRSFVRGIALPLMVMASASPIEAQFSRAWDVCGGNHFNTCASVHVTASEIANDDGYYDVLMRVWNLSGVNGTWEGTVFTKIGFFNTEVLGVAGTIPMVGPVRGSDDPEEWVLANDPKNKAGGVSLDMGALSDEKNSSVDDGIANACDPGALPGGANDLWQNPCFTGGFPPPDATGWINMQFQTTMAWSDLETTTDLLIMGQNGPDELSTQCITGGDNLNCQVVPEPETVVLLATGLSGLAFVARRRRKALIEGPAEDGQSAS